jgi:TRAP-type mannitol/chloroaromatic compound transport system permease small subunit
MRKVLAAIDQLSIWAGKISGFIILVVSLVVVWEVITRYFLHRPTSWAAESLGLGCAIAYAIGAAWVYQVDKHVKIEILYEKATSRVRAGMDVATYFFFLLYAGMMTWAAGNVGIKSLLMREGSGSPWNPPLYPVKLLFAFGFLILVLQGTAKFIRDLHFVATGRKL